MIAFYLLAAHLVGDFVVANRWQAAGKLTDRRLRAQHTIGYCLPFVPIAFVYGHFHGSPRWEVAIAFLLWLLILHYATDSHRFQSTLGDVVQWTYDRRVAPDIAVRSWINFLYGDPVDSTAIPLTKRLEVAADLDARRLRFPPPNPWTPIGLMIDQTLHVCQIALLAGLFLS